MDKADLYSPRQKLFIHDLGCVIALSVAGKLILCVRALGVDSSCA